MSFFLNGAHRKYCKTSKNHQIWKQYERKNEKKHLHSCCAQPITPMILSNTETPESIIRIHKANFKGPKSQYISDVYF